MSFDEDQIIPGFEKRLAAYVDESANSWWVGKCQFWLASLLCLTWPYRWYFRYKSGKTSYTVSKKIYLNRPADRTGNDVMSYRADAVQLPTRGSSDINEESDKDTKIQTERDDRLTTIPV